MQQALYLISHPGTTQPGIHSWAGEMSPGDGHDPCWGRNSEFCVNSIIGLVIRTSGILT